MRQFVCPIHVTLLDGLVSFARVVGTCNRRGIRVHAMTFSTPSTPSAPATAVVYVHADTQRRIDLLRRQLDRLVDVVAVEAAGRSRVWADRDDGDFAIIWPIDPPDAPR